ETFRGIGTCWTQKQPGQPGEWHFAVWDDVRTANPPRIMELPGATRGELVMQSGDRILGRAHFSDGKQQAFVTDPAFSAARFIGHLGFYTSQASVLNRCGEVGGSSEISYGLHHPVRWHEQGGIRDLLPSSLYAMITAGNDRSVMVGLRSVAPGVSHGVH